MCVCVCLCELKFSLANNSNKTPLLTLKTLVECVNGKN